jgi:hypothetical protein
VDGSGCHGLEAQLADVVSGTTVIWNWTAAVSAAAAFNTTTITTTLSCPTTTMPSTPNCWHLPSRIELQYLYEQKAAVGGFTNGLYWSSTEYDNNHVWAESFANGTQENDNRPNRYSVRAVRAF